MSGSLNLVVLIGRVGRDPEIRFTQGGDPVANISVATSERWTKDGQKQERTEWHSVTVFGKTAQFVRDYVQKGALVSVEGSIRYEEYKDKDGNDRKATKVKAQRVELLTGRGERSSETQSGPLANLPAEADEPVPF